MEKKFQCNFCLGRFAIESRYMKHRCKQMIRDDLFRTPTGQAAWLFYGKWMKGNRRQIPKPDAFLSSKFFNSFIKFAEFANNVNIPSVDRYITLMCKQSITPTMWCMDEAYALYIEFMDRKLGATDHAEITVDTLFDTASELNCDVENLFNHITPQHVLQLLRQRRISPWILLKSKKFKKFYVSCTNDEQMRMESVIHTPYWTAKFKDDAKSVDLMKTYITALSL